MRLTTLMGLLLLTTTSSLPAAELRPFRASYTVVWHGMAAGRSELMLERLPDGQWSYSSRSQARGIFRMALPTELSQRSTFVISDGQILPMRFQGDDGGQGRKRDSDLQFDWARGRVTGTAETVEVDLPLEPGLQDALSIQVSLMHALLQGQVPDRFRMLDKDKVKEYVYTQEGAQTLDTVLGPQKTVLFRSSRPGFTRGTWFWCAPDLGYLPVRVERRNGQKVEWSMTLQSAFVGTPD